jgi:hypothetical protein
LALLCQDWGAVWASTRGDRRYATQGGQEPTQERYTSEAE